jgi:ABC-type transport system involved in cytochrome c biogenesis permease subunit
MEADRADRWRRVSRGCFWTALGLAALMVVAMWWSASRPPASNNGYNIDAFAKLVVSSEGRVKPVDSAARDALDVFRGRQNAKTEDGTKPAVVWYLDALVRPDAAKDDKIFRIDHPGILEAIGIEPDGQRYFSYTTLRPHLQTLRQQAVQASRLKQANRSAYQKRLLRMFGHVQQFRRMRALETPYIIPPKQPGGEWQQFPHRPGADPAKASAANQEAVQAWLKILRAYNAEKPADFNAAVADYSKFLQDKLPSASWRAGLEVSLLNRFGPFYVGSILCIGVFLLGCTSWLVLHQPLRNVALAVAIVALVLVTLGIVARIYIQIRPPVTNLYSSAIFVAWGCLLFGVGIDWLFRNSAGLVAGAIGGFTSLVLAMNLASGDTMGMMQAVLDTNFWLATHVVTVTTGYFTTFVAGMLGIIFIGLGVVATLMSDEQRQSLAGTGKTLAKMIYGVVCFALLFSFVGTVLGGIWADQSWGRFWGWDPKENGAALIVLMNALILHARWGGMIRERGLAVLAVCGNIITAWSWFGTNLLGVGLHSYGFMESGVFWLGNFVLSQMAIIAVGLLPLRVWQGSELMQTPRRVQQQRQRAARAGQSPPGDAAGPTAPAGGNA